MPRPRSRGLEEMISKMACGAILKMETSWSGVVWLIRDIDASSITDSTYSGHFHRDGYLRRSNRRENH